MSTNINSNVIFLLSLSVFFGTWRHIGRTFVWRGQQYVSTFFRLFTWIGIVFCEITLWSNGNREGTDWNVMSITTFCHQKWKAIPALQIGCEKVRSISAQNSKPCHLNTFCHNTHSVSSPVYVLNSHKKRHCCLWMLLLWLRCVAVFSFVNNVEKR